MALRTRDGHFHYRFQVLGKVYSGNTGLRVEPRNLKKAQEIEARARALAQDGRGWELTVKPIPFGTAAEQYLEHHRLVNSSPATVLRIASSLRNLNQFFGSRPLTGITPGDIEDYMADRRQTVKPITLRHDLHTLSPLFEYAIRHRWARENPVEQVEIPTAKDAVRIHVINETEEAAYFDVATRLRNWDLRDVAKIMILQGARPSEVVAARKEDLDPGSSTWNIPDSKTRAGRRTLKLVPESREILGARWLRPDGSPWLFPRLEDPGRHLPRMNDAHDRVVKAAGVSFVLYDLRHTFATRIVRRGMPLAILAKILGHASINVTLRHYVHLADEDAHKAMIEYGNDTAIAAKELLLQLVQ